MRCLSPLIGWKSRKVNPSGLRSMVFNIRDGYADMPLKVPCSSCVNCLLERSRQHAVRCVHESRMWDSCCFVTLTYDDAHLPYAASLNEPDVVLFLKSLRERYDSQTIRYFYCGEYGERFGRPHYHLLLFGIDFEDKISVGRRNGETVWTSRILDGLWKRGRTEIGSVSFASAGYVAGYVMKKQIRPGVHELREPEFVRMSYGRGGLGALGVPWLKRWHSDVYPKDEVILDGAASRPPRRYDLEVSRWLPDVMDAVKEARVAKRSADSMDRFGFYDPLFPDSVDVDGSSSRLSVIEECVLAKVNLFAREMEECVR